jgi:hypothetical protein
MNAYDTALDKAFRQYGRSEGDTAILINGKDADLDRGGQVRVTLCGIDEDGYIHADVKCYAVICSPEDEESAEIAEAIVMDFTEYSGVWDGDYWVFGAPEFRVKVEAPAEVGTEDDAPLWAEALYKAIRTHPTVADFEQNIAALYDDVENIKPAQQDNSPWDDVNTYGPSA